jgi:hypothetical protein
MLNTELDRNKLSDILYSGFNQDSEVNIFKLTMQTIMELAKAEQNRGPPKMPPSFSLTGRLEYVPLCIPARFV